MSGEKRLRRLTALAALVAAAILSSPLTANQGDDRAFEKSLDAALRDVINLGATLFNNQDDHAGCYRVFEGALRTSRPVLGKYPDLQRKIDIGLTEAGKMPRMHDRAHALRKVLDEVRSGINPAVRPVAKSLWDRLGGEKGVNKVLSDFLPLAAADPKVDFFRGNKYALISVPALHKSVLDFISSATGGPHKYTGKSMKETHTGMGITGDQFDAMAGHLKYALEKNGVSPEDVNAMLAAVAGTRPDIVDATMKKQDVFQPDPPVKKDDLIPPIPPIKKIDDNPPDLPFKQPDPKKVVPADPNMARVKGTVSIGGQPLTFGYVTFVNAGGQRFSANVKKDGAFAFYKGFAPGDYAVLVEDDPTPPAFGDLRPPIPPEYADATRSPLRFTATKGENTINISVK